MADMAPRRGRRRIAAAARKIAAAAEDAHIGEADQVALGVRAVAKEIAGVVEPGALYWRAPLQYVCEQAAPRVAKEFGLPDDARDELSAYLMSGMQEFLVALMGEFDRDHFAAWVAAMLATESAGEG